MGVREMAGATGALGQVWVRPRGRHASCLLTLLLLLPGRSETARPSLPGGWPGCAVPLRALSPGSSVSIPGELVGTASPRPTADPAPRLWRPAWSCRFKEPSLLRACEGQCHAHAAQRCPWCPPFPAVYWLQLQGMEESCPAGRGSGPRAPGKALFCCVLLFLFTSPHPCLSNAHHVYILCMYMYTCDIGQICTLLHSVFYNVYYISKRYVFLVCFFLFPLSPVFHISSCCCVTPAHHWAPSACFF